MIGKIIKLTGGFYYIKSGDKIFETRARGNFRHLKVEPIVGDDVEFKYEEKTLGYIEKVYPRKNILTRPKVSNVDLALIVIPVMDPKYNFMIIDKTIVQAEHQGIDVAIAINKCDLNKEDADNLEKIYKNSGFKTFLISKDDEKSVNLLKKYLKGKTVAFCGVSGAGKSTITSLILNRDVEVGEQCKFRNCNHIKEPKCAVKYAVEKGQIEKSRYENYKYIYNELKERGEY